MDAVELVATVGPASFGDPVELCEAGATALRLNGSHLSSGELDAVLTGLRAKLGDVSIVVDLQGAKMRVGHVPDRALQAGEPVAFELGDHGTAAGAIPVPHAELFRAVRCGETLRCDDDRLRFEVTAVAESRLEARCESAGVLRARKGLNVLEHPVQLDDLGARDQKHIAVALGHGPMRFAVSFMSDGREASWVRRRAPDCPVIGKVEQRAALDHLAQLRGAVDELWICRGDLGAQLGARDLARFVANFRPEPGGIPTLMAGQVLEQLTHHSAPTRSELCHLFDLIQRGYRGIVLSDETALGVDPAGAVRAAAKLLRDLGHR